MRTISSVVTSLTLMFTISTFAEEEKSPLAKEMDAMNDSYKKVYRAVRKGKIEDKEDLIAATKKLKEGFQRSKELIPPMVTKMPDGATKTKMIEDYKKAIDESITLCDQLVKDLQAGDKDAAKKTANALKKGKSSGHEKFQEDE